MNTTDRAQQIREEIRAKLREAAPLLQGFKVVLFGSRAQGTQKERSDFDVGILGERPMPAQDLFRIEQALEDIDTLYTIELVDLGRTSPRFRAEALSEVEVLYE